MMELFSGLHPHKALCSLVLAGERWWTVDALDSVWLGMKLGVAVIGIVMMGFLWRGIWRSKRAGAHKDR